MRPIAAFANEKCKVEKLVSFQYGFTFGTSVFETGGTPEAPTARIGGWLRGVTNAMTGRLPPIATGIAAVQRIDPTAWVGAPEAALAAGNQGRPLIAHDTLAATIARIRHRPMSDLVRSLSRERRTASAGATIRAVLVPALTASARGGQGHNDFSRGRSAVVQPPPVALIKPTLACRRRVLRSSAVCSACSAAV
jgi:hypothetical protein